MNSSNTSHAPNPVLELVLIDPSVVKLAFGVITGFAILGGMASLFLMGIIIQDRTLFTGGGFLIAHLQLVNAVVCLVHYPVSTIVLLGRHVLRWELSPGICNYLEFPHLVPISAYTLADAFLAINRFVAILFPHKYRSSVSGFVLGGTVIATWMIAFAIVIPGVFKIGVHFTFVIDGTCDSQIRSPLGFILISIGTWIPQIVAFLGYFALWVSIGKAWRNNRARQAANDGPQAIRSHQPSTRRVRITKTLTAIFLLNFVCFYISPFVNHYGNVGVMFKIWQRMIHLLAHVVSPVRFGNAVPFFLNNNGFQRADGEIIRDQSTRD